MAFRRRARVARFYPGIGVSTLSASEVMAYDGLISVIAAEDALREGRCQSPEEIGAAVAAVTGDELKGQVAAAKAKLARAVQEKGF